MTDLCSGQLKGTPTSTPKPTPPTKVTPICCLFQGDTKSYLIFEKSKHGIWRNAELTVILLPRILINILYKKNVINKNEENGKKAIVGKIYIILCVSL
jgi:hypothetical protein